MSHVMAIAFSHLRSTWLSWKVNMLLYLSDREHYPRAIADTRTKNQSFVAMAYRYKLMGIENYYFMLALHNPDLQGVDPFDPNLTHKQKTDIAYECKTNPWYFIREVARLPPMAGIEPMPFKANRGNIALIWCFLNHITAILIQPRQTGKSGSVDILTVWIIDIAGNHTNMLMITKGSDLQSEAISRIKAMRELLPNYLYAKHKLDSDNKTGFNNTALSNKYMTGVARANKMAANNLGRGMTVPIIHIDEPPFITHIGVTMPAAKAAGGAVRAFAEKNGSLYGTILTTTAGRRDDRDGGYMYNYVAESMVFNEVLFDCRNRLDAVKMVDRNCTGLGSTVNITMSHRQLGYSDEWLYRTMREVGGTREEMERDFFNIWNSGSMRSPLSAELNDLIQKSKKDPLSTEVTAENYIVKWYVTSDELTYLKKHSRLIMGADTSEASGRDAIAMVIVDAATLQVVGAATIALTNLIEYAKWLASFLIEHPEITLIPERKSTGPMIIDMLLIMLPQAGIDPFKRIFNSIVDKARLTKKDEEAYQQLSTPLSQRDEFFYTSRKTAFGFMTDSNKRILLYGNILQQAAKQSAKLINDETLAKEIMGLTEKNGRIDHSTLGHDDHVIAWLLAHWLLNRGMNLTHYGIEPSLVMSALLDDDVQESKTIADQWKDHLQKSYLEEIEDLVETLAECENIALTALYEQKLQFLSRKIEASGRVKDFSVDAVMDSVRKARETKLRLGQAMGSSDPDQQVRQSVENVIDSYRNNHYRVGSGIRW